MAFNPKPIKSKSKALPVVLLLDVSGSMSGEKIDTLNTAVRDMLKAFTEFKSAEQIVQVAIISFGDVTDVHLRYTKSAAALASWRDLSADGMTPLGDALTMAKEMVEDTTETPGNWYRPIVALVSDGMPNDDWQGPLNRFVNDGRSSKCMRMAMMIGEEDRDAQDVLNRFIGGSVGADGNPIQLFTAADASDITKFFVMLSQSIKTESVKVSTPPVQQPSPAQHSSPVQQASKKIHGSDEFI